MPFKQGRHPCLALTEVELERFTATLADLGYRRHLGMRAERHREIAAWLAPHGRGEQIHVQAAWGHDGLIEIFAHAEPASGTVEHWVAALLDQASFRRGTELLLAALRDEGWRVDRYRP